MIKDNIFRKSIEEVLALSIKHECKAGREYELRRLVSLVVSIASSLTIEKKQGSKINAIDIYNETGALRNDENAKHFNISTDSLSEISSLVNSFINEKCNINKDGSLTPLVLKILEFLEDDYLSPVASRDEVYFFLEESIECFNNERIAKDQRRK